MNHSPQAKVLLAAEHTLANLDSLHTTQLSQFIPLVSVVTAITVGLLLLLAFLIT